GPAIGHGDNHGHCLLVSDQVVEDDIRHAALGPLVVIAANAVQQVKDGIIVGLGIAWRRVDSHLALPAADLGLVFNGFHFAVFNSLALGIIAFWRRAERFGFVLFALVLSARGGAAQRQQ